MDGQNSYLCNGHKGTELEKECQFCNETRKVDIYEDHKQVGCRFLCDFCKKSHKNTKIKCNNVECKF